MILTEIFWKHGSLPGENGEEAALQANTTAYAKVLRDFWTSLLKTEPVGYLNFFQTEIWPNSFPLQLATERV